MCSLRLACSTSSRPHHLHVNLIIGVVPSGTVPCDSPGSLQQAVVGLRTVPNKVLLQELVVKDLDLTGSQVVLQLGAECGSSSVVMYSTCDVSSYTCKSGQCDSCSYNHVPQCEPLGHKYQTHPATGVTGTCESLAECKTWYVCAAGREATAGVSSSGCQQLELDKSSKTVYCPTNMAVVKINKDGANAKVDGIKCCPVAGW